MTDLGDPGRLRQIRDDLISMVEDPMQGFGFIEIGDRGLDLENMTADFVIPFDDGRYEVTIRRVS